MVKHCIQIMTASDVDTAKVQTKIDNLKDKYGEALVDENRDLRESQTIDGSVKYYISTFIVYVNSQNKTTEKNDLLEQIEKEIDKSASWYQVRYHECNHDESNPDSGCSWNYQNSGGTVPSEVAW